MLSDKNGLEYICGTAERFFAVISWMGGLIVFIGVGCFTEHGWRDILIGEYIDSRGLEIVDAYYPMLFEAVGEYKS